MLNIQTIYNEYIRYANRTIECVEIIKNQSVLHYWIYNYQGNHFRVFDSLLDVFAFLNNQCDNNWVADFDTEEELDSFLLSITPAR
jgi:hypothetical protein